MSKAGLSVGPQNRRAPTTPSIGAVGTRLGGIVVRIAVAGFMHETNTFAEHLTPLSDFERSGGFPGLMTGQQVIGTLRTAAVGTGGFITAAEAAGDVELVPLLWTFPQPSGTIEQSAFETVVGMLLERLREAGPLDGLLLELHGAMVTEKYPDAEGELLRRLREIVGPELPIIATLDLHANISPEMVERTTTLLGYDTYPHVDALERGQEALQLMRRTCLGEIRPTAALAQIPMLIAAPRQCTLLSPMQDLMAVVHECEQRPGILAITFSGGFAFADTPVTGASMVVTTDNDPELAAETARELAARVWDRREEFRLELTPVREAIDWALANGGPVILADGSDNPGGGTPCDGTVMLQEMVEADVPNSTVCLIVDPEAVAEAWEAGVGQTLTLTLGGKTDKFHGEPLTLTGTVRLLSDGNYVNEGPMFTGLPIARGRTVVFVVGGIEVILAERRAQPYDAQALRSLGIEPTERLLIGLKSAVHFRAHYGPMAKRVFDLATPGIHSPDIAQYTYHHLRHPLWPLDED